MTAEDPMLGMTEAQLERNTRAGWSLFVRFAVYPFPGFIPAMLMAFVMTQFVPFLWAAAIVFMLWGVVGFALNADKFGGWYQIALNMLEAGMARLFRREPAPDSQEHLALLQDAHLQSGFTQMEDVPELPRVEWATPARNEEHARYRSEYNKLAALMPTLARGIDAEGASDRRRTILYLAEITDGLHNYGDNPLAVAAVVPAPAPETPVRQGFLGALPAVAGFNLVPWLAGAALMAVAAIMGLFGLWRGAEAKSDRFEQQVASLEIENGQLTAQINQRDIALQNARTNAQETAEAIMEQRRRDAASAASRRRIERDIANAIRDVAATAPPEWEAMAAPSPPLPVAGDGLPVDGPGPEPQGGDAPSGAAASPSS